MRLGIDVRPLAQPEMRGIGRYAFEMTSRLLREHGSDHDWRLMCLGAEPVLIPDAIVQVGTLHHRRVGKLALHHAAARTLRRYDDRALGRLDAFFMPAAHMVALDPSVPLVIAAHDTFWADGLDRMSRRERVWHRVAAPARLYGQAARLLASSQATANRLHELLPAMADRIVVTPLGIDDVFREPVPAERIEEVRQRLRLPEQFVLFLGAVEPRKNVHNLLLAFHKARARGLRHQLVLAGSMSAESEAGLHGLLGAGVTALGFVDEADKPALYAAATAFAMPSWDEGFGFPPLEALACGTPSLVSDIEVFRETLGDAALRCPPGDVDGMAEALWVLCADPETRARLVGDGADVVARYDWTRCADLVYAEILAAASEGAQSRAGRADTSLASPVRR